MRNVNLIVIVLKGHLEGKGVVIAPAFFLHRVLIVGDIFAITVPTYTPGAVSIFNRINKWLLALVIAAIRFYQIDYVEFVANIFAYIGDLEVKPLGIVGCLVVVFENQVVVVRFAHLNDST
jgi:hypothetical protein